MSPITAAAVITPKVGRTSLVGLIFAVSMTTIDQTIVALSAPTIQSQLGLSHDGIQWAVNVYLLTTATFFLLGGRLADVFGRKRMVLNRDVGTGDGCRARERSRGRASPRGAHHGSSTGESAGVPTDHRRSFPHQLDGASLVQAIRRVVDVALAYDATRITLSITDDGSGFDPLTASDGFGLAGMRARVQEIGGTMSIDSVPSRGTRITARIPVAGAPGATERAARKALP